jgi:1-acyl-sn-glycerol-3-phosphate acyltransferase
MGDFIHKAGRVLLNQTVRLYYRRIEVEHADRIPASGPGILVANHPNSTMDAFVLCMATRRKISFIAKDSITRAPAFAWLARQFGVVGVARGMDYGGQRERARDRNRAAIAACVPRLLARELLIIFERVTTEHVLLTHSSQCPCSCLVRIPPT